MLSNWKPLVVVLFFALVTFRVARPFCLRFMSAQAFERRRNAWLGLTVVAFLSPTFWIFAMCEFVVLIWMLRREDNPLALFAMVTFVVPNVRFYLPTVLVNQLFDLTQYRILALVLLVATVHRIFRRVEGWSGPKLGIVDVLMLGFIVIQIAVPSPYESVTATMRHTLLVTLDIFLVVYAFQRLATKERIVDVMACYWLSIAIMAPIAVFETLKGWLLYTGLNDLWGDPAVFSYLMRGSSLRAQVAAGHSINLGYQFATALGFFLFLWRPDLSRRFAWLAVVTLAAGLLATTSRGALLTAVITATVFFAFRPNAGRKLARTAFGLAVVLGLMYISPLKESVLDRLPIIGTADQDTIDYRRQLLEVSLQLIQQNPWFGDPFVATRMESLRQGQGIIDIVNGYIFVALFNGLIALAFVVASFVIALVRAYFARLAVRGHEDMATMGVALFATFIGTVFYIATAGITTTHYIVLGLLCSYWQVARRSALPVPQATGLRGASMKLRQTSYP